MADTDLKPLLQKLDADCRLSDDDRQAVLGMPHSLRTVPPATYLIREGEPPRNCTILLSGFACRHKIVGAGGRQIISMQIPGDALDFHSLYLDCADHNAQTLTRATMAVVPMNVLKQLLEERPAIGRAVLSDILVEASVLREWIANVGRRNARTRIAHLLCEFAYRMNAQCLGSRRYELPMTQEQIGDACGLTAVHVNRSLRALEADGLIARDGRAVTFPDIERLRAVGDFSELYLHLEKRPRLT